MKGPKILSELQLERDIHWADRNQNLFTSRATFWCRLSVTSLIEIRSLGSTLLAFTLQRAQNDRFCVFDTDLLYQIMFFKLNTSQAQFCEATSSVG